MIEANAINGSVCTKKGRHWKTHVAFLQYKFDIISDLLNNLFYGLITNFAYDVLKKIGSRAKPLLKPLGKKVKALSYNIKNSGIKDSAFLLIAGPFLLIAIAHAMKKRPD